MKHKNFVYIKPNTHFFKNLSVYSPQSSDRPLLIPKKRSPSHIPNRDRPSSFPKSDHLLPFPTAIASLLKKRSPSHVLNSDHPPSQKAIAFSQNHQTEIVFPRSQQRSSPKSKSDRTIAMAIIIFDYLTNNSMIFDFPLMVGQESSF
jgi:hypothetical protein